MEEYKYREFIYVVENTLCPYSDRESRIGPAWNDAVTFAENIQSNAIELERFFNTFFQLQSHGYVMEVKSQAVVTNLYQFARLFYKILVALSDVDPNKSNCLESTIDSVGWQYEFCGFRTFITAFAPCYTKRHPRYSYSTELSYLFFQPEKSFSFCGVNSKNRKAKELARQRFKEAGRPYDGRLIDRRVEAWLYILPDEIGDPPIEWWDS